MIILAPETGSKIAGFLLPNVNTRPGGSRCVATEFASVSRRAGIEKAYENGRISKARGQGAGNTPTALTQPLPLSPEGGQAVQKPMAPSYRSDGRPAATSGRHPVAIMTVTSSAGEPWA